MPTTRPAQRVPATVLAHTVPALRRDSGRRPGPRTAAAAAGSARQYRPGRTGRNTRARQDRQAQPDAVRSRPMTQISRSARLHDRGGWPAKPHAGR